MKGNKHSKNFLLQSAMEYLMTYGWAILILAIVLGALFQLGVFNASSFSPRASPGACKIQRTTTPGGTVASLIGTCGGQLPQYVAQFSGQSYAAIPTSPTLTNFNGASKLTIIGWIKATAMIGGAIADCGFQTVSLTSSGGSTLYPGMYLNVGGTVYGVFSANAISTNTWYQEASTYDGSNINIYINGVLVKTTAAPGTITNSQVACNGGLWTIGKNSYGGWQTGSISNVQIYNASLPASDINALYLKGIGSVPIDLVYLTGWWPLNGNANDYSGNNNNGVPTGISFTSQYGK